MSWPYDYEYTPFSTPKSAPLPGGGRVGRAGARRCVTDGRGAAGALSPSTAALRSSCAPSAAARAPCAPNTGAARIPVGGLPPL